jgi:hypothetical protein
MEIAINARNKGSRGLNKVVLAIIAVALVGGIFLMAKFAPPIQKKWDLETRMGDTIGRMSAIGQEGIFSDITAYCEKNEIPCVPEEQCHLTGEPGKFGQMSCSYMVDINFPFMKEPYQYNVVATAKRKRIPENSN